VNLFFFFFFFWKEIGFYLRCKNEIMARDGKMVP
jgi:hypothetical protein